MSDQAPALLVVPTELERTDGFIDLAVLACSGLAIWYLALQGIPITFIAPFTLPLGIWVLTGEAAADVPFVGAVAAGLRNLFGQRRAHEWLLAYGHYFRLAIWPAWRSNVVRVVDPASATSRCSHVLLDVTWMVRRAWHGFSGKLVRSLLDHTRRVRHRSDHSDNLESKLA